MTGKKGYTEENAKTIDQWVDDGWIWGMPISHEVYERAVKGDWDMVLTPTKPVPKSWFQAFRQPDSWTCLRGRTTDADFRRMWRYLYGAGLFRPAVGK